MELISGSAVRKLHLGVQLIITTLLAILIAVAAQIVAPTTAHAATVNTTVETTCVPVEEHKLYRYRTRAPLTNTSHQEVKWIRGWYVQASATHTITFSRVGGGGTVTLPYQWVAGTPGTWYQIPADVLNNVWGPNGVSAQFLTYTGPSLPVDYNPNNGLVTGQGTVSLSSYGGTSVSVTYTAWSIPLTTTGWSDWGDWTPWAATLPPGFSSVADVDANEIQVGAGVGATLGGSPQGSIQAEAQTVPAQVCEPPACPPNYTGTPPNCNPPVTTTKIRIKKVALKKSYRVGQVATYRIVVKNTGSVTAKKVKVCDTLGAGLKFKSVNVGQKTIQGQKVCWLVAKIAPGKSRAFTLRAKVVGVIKTETEVGPLGDHISVYKEESQVDFNPGETRTVTLSCRDGGIAMDGSLRIDHVDQDTGVLGDVVIKESRRVDKSTYQFEAVNGATGRAQAKAFVTCLGASTVQSHHPLVVGPIKSVTKNVNTGDKILLKCPTGTIPVGIGYRVNSGTARQNYSEPVGATNWKVGYNTSGSVANVTASYACLTKQVAGRNLQITHVVETVTLAPGETRTVSVTCATGAKGVVATYDVHTQYGHDPRPITRAFVLHNPTGAPLTVKVDLVCVGDRLSGKLKRTYRAAKNVVVAKAINSKATRGSAVIAVRA